MDKFKSLFLQNKSLKQTMFKNIFWLSISQISRVLRIITLLYAARILGATEYGIFAYILGAVGVFSIFADMGITSLLTRDVAREPQSQKEYFTTSFWIKISLVAFTSFIFVIFVPYFIKSEAVIHLIPLAAFLIIFDNIRDFIVAYLRGLQKMERETMVVTILNVALAFLGFFTLLFYPTAKNFFAVYVISSAFGTVAAILIVRETVVNLLSGFRIKIAKEIWKNGWPVALLVTFGMFMLTIDIFMLGWWRTSVEIGLYAAGQKIIQVLYTLPTLLASGVFPTISAIIKKGDKIQEKKLNEKSISSIFLLTIPLVVGGIILGESIFKILFGHEYIAGVPAFHLLLLNILIVFPGIMIANLVLAHNQQKKMLKYVIIAALANIGLNILLIPKIGIVGAALGTLVAQIINYGFAWQEMRKISSFEIFPHLKKISASVAVMGILSFVLDTLQVYVLLNIVLSAFVYFAMLSFLKEKLLGEIKTFIKSSTVIEASAQTMP